MNKGQIFSKKWKVKGLGDTSGTASKEYISIDARKFNDVAKYIVSKGYRVKTRGEGETRYNQTRFAGLEVVINPSQKTIVVEALGQSAIGQVVNDFDLPLYNKG
jgi:hypothetical protein